MKKLLLVALAVVGLASCVQNEELVVPQNTAAISFAEAFVDNATKADPSITGTNINAFDVWAFMEEVGGTVFTDENVTKDGSVWRYDNIQYWYPERTYYFAALAPMDSANVTETLASGEAAKLGLGTVSFTNVDGTEDLLYAKKSVTTPNAATLANQGMEPVKMQFQHLLSKVKFTFQNGFNANNTTVEVSGVTMSAPKKGTIDLAVADYAEGWGLDNETITLAFGDVAGALALGASAEAADERLTIPAAATQEYAVSFHVVVKQGAVKAMESDLNATISGIALEMGKAYNFTAVINQDVLDLKPIEFTAAVEDWDTEIQGPVGHYVSTAAELETLANAATEDITIALGADITGDVMLVEKPGVHVTIDGNGHKYDGQIKIHANSTRNTGAITIQNVKFQTSTPETNFVYAVDFGSAQRYSQNITVKDCSFEDLTTRSSEPTVVGVKVNATQNLVIKNCEAKNLHSLLQAQSCDADVVVEGVEVEGCKNGISFGNTARPVLRHSVIKAAEYGIRADGNASRGALIVENTTIEAEKPIIVRKVTTPVYDVKLGVDVVLNTAEDYHVVFTKGSDDVAYVAPAEGAFKYSSVAEFNVFPLTPMLEDIKTVNPNDGDDAVYEGIGIDSEGAYVVTEAAGMLALSELIAADKDDNNNCKGFAGKTVKLDADVDLSEDNWDPIGDNSTDVAFAGVFDGQGHTIKGAHITGDHCFNGSVYGNKEGWGLFAVVDGATVKNLKVDGATFGSYTVISGVIAGYANNTTFENIDITNSKVAGYNWYTGGVVGWAQGECTFKDVNLDETVAVGTLWDSHGQNAGGIAGGVSASSKIIIEDCNIACVMDVINDVTSNYKWCVYRVAGMLIGNTNTTETKYNEVVTATATNVTCKNVTVTYGKWMNYHYCEGFWNRGWGRYESSDYVGGVDQDVPHNHADGENHCECFPFDQLFGGSSNGSGHYPVKGLAEFPGVTVVYPAVYTCPTCGQQHGK